VQLAATGIGGWLAVLAWTALGIGLLVRATGDVHYRMCWPGMGHLLCGLSVAALTVNHFLARVVVLDLLSLATVLPYGRPRDRPPFRAVRSYLILKLGDVALLAMVLSLYAHADTFLIDDMIRAGQELPVGRQIPLCIAGLGAAWIKLGLSPAQSWVKGCAANSPPAARWVLAGGLPLLGAYLLYRLRPIVAATGMTVWLVLCGLAIVANTIRSWRMSLRTEQTALVALSSLHGALAFILLSTPVFRYYLLSFVPIRLAISLVFALRTAPMTRPSFGAERDTLWLCRLADRVAAADRDLFQRTEARVADGTLRVANLAEAHFEFRLNRLVDCIVRFCGSAAEGIQRLHTGRLRLNLRWAVFAVVVVLLASALWPLARGG
jgi:hypothetical protein